MKKFLAAVLILLMLCLHAQAEENMYYTLSKDIYFHVNAVCGGVEDRVPLSETAAREFQKYLCPVCGPIKQGISAKSVVRGGTIVSRIPQSWLDDPAKTTTSVFAAPSEAVFEGSDAYARLSELLHGEFYTSFMEEYLTNGSAKATVRVPDILWQQGELIMNQRHFGGVYYIVLRPRVVFEDSYTTHARFFEHDISMENGILKDVGAREWNASGFNVALDRISEGTTVYNGINNGLQISIFREMDTNIAVITELNADKNHIGGVYFAINGRDFTELSGYMDGNNAVYCCVLTDAEADLVQNGAEVSISRENIMKNADFEGTDYAIVQSGEYYGIIDKNQSFAVDTKYQYIRRSAYDHIFILSEAETYNKTIFDADEKRIIAYLDDEDYHQGDIGTGHWPEVQNKAVFTLRTGQYQGIYSMKTGELISVLGYAGCGNLNGVFLGPVSGDPDRLVSRTEGVRLMDLKGNFCSESYSSIVPLIWHGENGLFIIANMEKEYEIGTDGRKSVDPGWRCGLIDQDGTMLAAMEYVRADIVSGYRISLQDADGRSYDFMLG